MNSSRLILALCTASLIAGCAQTADKDSGKGAIFPSGFAGSLKEAERIVGLPTETQHKELADLSTKGNGSNQTIRAMFYTLTNSQYCAAPSTAESASANSNASDALARKWDKERKALAKQLKEATEENQKLAQKARDEQMRADDLQQKLDELKNIETSIGNREQGTRR